MQADHEYLFSPLPPLFYAGPSQLSEKLPDLNPLFFVPPLEERPQNPIVESISNARSLSRYEEDIASEKDGDREVDIEVEEKEEDIWVYREERPPQNHVFSWDALSNKIFPRKPAPTPFLSQQPSDIFDAVRHYVQPRIDDSTLELKYILPAQLLQHLLINVLGNSSPLYIWNTSEERLVPSSGRNAANILVIIEGLDSTASASVINRFLNIGTMIRRIELFITKMRRQNGNPTLHAFVHSLSTLIVHFQTVFARRPPYPLHHLTSIWIHYSEYEDIVLALAFLCHRHRDPPYDQLPESPPSLLSHIFACLEKYIEQAAPRQTIAALAYILTATSGDYFSEIGESIGLSDLSRAPWLRLRTQFKASQYRDTFDRDDHEAEFQGPSSMSASEDFEKELPTFFPKELVEAFPVARKSLSLLRAADPEHELSFTRLTKTCEWVWSEEEVESLWMSADSGVGVERTSSLEQHDIKDNVGNTDVPSDRPVQPPIAYPPGLEIFEVFDLEPGTHMVPLSPFKSTPSNANANSLSSVASFLSSFPSHLPLVTPTLSHLAILVLEPLMTRTTILSKSLLELFLGPLQLRAHLELLKSYLLLTHYSFKRRLVDALFEDEMAERRVETGNGVLTLERHGMVGDSGSGGVEGNDDNDDLRHGIGLGSGLAPRGTWPPGGTDLSFLLRSVVVDSINEMVQLEDTGTVTHENVWKEAGVRLGFALRDLPVGGGKGRWLNPMSIEALDFLYLDYKPPHPIDVVITPAILFKYQRIFTFVLRYFRAEMVARMAYRCTFKFSESSSSSTPSTPRTPVFSYVPKAQAMLIDLRFQIQTFVTSFSGYIVNSAIGANFDSYIRRVSEVGTGKIPDQAVTAGAESEDKEKRKDQDKDRMSQLENAKQEHDITNVFALRDSHSQLLDRILSGCLLRTAQRAAGDALGDLLDIVLQFGALVRDLRRGAISEIEGAERVEEMYLLFRKRMFRFIGVIQTMRVKEQNQDHDKGVFSGLDITMELQGRHNGSEPRSYLEELMTSIDPTRWWRQNVEKDRQKRPD